MDNAQPIIVKKIKKGGHGHHGGGWKVAFADFATAMMAFFMLMWLMGSASDAEKDAISDYFQNPSGIQGPGGASTSMIKLGSVQAEKAAQKAQDKDADGAKADHSATKSKESRDAKQEAVRLDSLKKELEKAIEASEELKQFKDQLLLDMTSEGLRIQIIDKENRPMFGSGSAKLQNYTIKILQEIAKIIGKAPNKVSLTGHTDATPFRSFKGYTNWELSTERANASRRALINGGLATDKVAKVVGLSSTVLFDSTKPHSPVNRRISLIVMNKQTEDKLLNQEGAHPARTVAKTLSKSNSQGITKPVVLGKPRSGSRAIQQPTLKMLGAPKKLRSPNRIPKSTPAKDNQPIKLQTF